MSLTIIIHLLKYMTSKTQKFKAEAPSEVADNSQR